MSKAVGKKAIKVDTTHRLFSAYLERLQNKKKLVKK
jgi:hypothetical protein|tara:strand:+ start:2259 stop:2366 length:108 start_codon:yes stop_codon:yes gene_type:complete